jgi:hypothetical protein
MAGSLQQSGTVTPGHVPVVAADGVVSDGGTAGAPSTNPALGGIGVVAATGLGFTMQTAPVPSPYVQFGFGWNPSNGNAQISLGSYGGASSVGLEYVVNGSTYGFPGPGTGNVLGPNVAVSGHLAAFNGTSGSVIADSGIAQSSVVTASGGATVSAAMTPVVGASTVLNGFNALAASGGTVGAGLTVTSGGLTVTAGGATVAAGGLAVQLGGAGIVGNSTVTGGLTVSAGIAVNTGGVVVSAGGATVAAGNLTVGAGTTVANATVTGTVGAGSTVVSNAGGFRFPDGTTQTTAAVNPGMTWLATQAASASAALAFTSVVSASYDAYEIVMEDLVLATNTAVLYIQVSTDNGASWKTTGYVNNTVYFGSGGPGYIANTGGLEIGVSVYAQTLPYHGRYTLSNANLSSDYVRLYGQTTCDSGGTPVAVLANGRYNTTGACNAFRLTASAGSLTSGTVRVYGLRN